MKRILKSTRYQCPRLLNGEIVKAVPEGTAIPMVAAKGLFAHNIKEFSNLATILPEVYAENRDNL